MPACLGLLLLLGNPDYEKGLGEGSPRTGAVLQRRALLSLLVDRIYINCVLLYRCLKGPLLTGKLPAGL